MLRRFFRHLARLGLVVATAFTAAAAAKAPATDALSAPAASAPSTITGAKKHVVVIPVQEQVDTPLLFIIRRGLKEAIENKADVVVLDMKTPGGALDATFEIMEALAKFPGKTITLDRKSVV